MRFTVVGSGGFIGSALTNSLRNAGHTVLTPTCDAADLNVTPLDHVIYAAGVTADFRVRPFDTLRANTTLLADLLEHAQFESLLYLSSARVYRHADHSGEEATIFLRPGDPEDLYDLTKLTGEALCYASRRDRVRVVRLTNVIGTDFASTNFLFELIRSACDVGHIELRSALDSAKDYVLLEDVLSLLPKIASGGRQSCYNLGSGNNLTNAELLHPILSITQAQLVYGEWSPRVVTPVIDISRIRSEFAYQPSPVLPYVPELVHKYQKLNHAEN